MATMTSRGFEDDFTNDQLEQHAEQGIQDLEAHLGAERGMPDLEAHLRQAAEAVITAGAGSQAGQSMANEVQGNYGFEVARVGRYVTEFALGGKRRQMRLPTGRVALYKPVIELPRGYPATYPGSDNNIG
jgi:hypothetical protein